MTRIRTIAMTSVLSLVLAACGGLSDDGNGTGGGGEIDHPTGANELVLRWEYQGGFVPWEYTLKRAPGWSLFGDGRIIVEGPMIEIYPGPALPNLLVTRLSEDGVQAILRAAKAAGLMDGDASYPYRCITDAATTVFTTNAEGSMSVVSAYALGDATGGSCPGVDVEARQELFDFLSKLGDLSWLPEGSVGAEEPFTADEVRIHVLPYQGEPDLPQLPVDWPLVTALDAFGEAVQGGLAEARCGVVSGADLDALWPLMQAANDLTPWVSDGKEYRLILRPLLPDEHGC